IVYPFGPPLKPLRNRPLHQLHPGAPPIFFEKRTLMDGTPRKSEPATLPPVTCSLRLVFGVRSAIRFTL
ncbi:MAG: hypothetical protein AAF357_15920, partial [Verrucomicrobiota bacterium]